MDNKINEVEELINTGKLEKAEKLLLQIEDNNIASLFLKGKIYQKKQKWGDAINTYKKILQLDAGNKEAHIQINIIQNILNFSNPEMFNP